jgi:hypothetical protein
MFSMLIFTKEAYSQKVNYQDYYNLIHEAEELNYSEKHKEAFHLYVEAFRTEFPFNKDIYKANRVYDVLLEKGDSSMFSEQKMILKFRETFFSKDIYKKASINDSDKVGLISFFPYLSFNNFLMPEQSTVELVNLISNSFFTDQTVRRVPKKNNEYRDYMLHVIDSILYVKIISYLQGNGMPNRQLIGGYYHSLHVLLLHGSYHVGISTSLDSILKSSILMGNYSPSNYAFLVDKYKTWNLEEPQIYGQFCTLNYELENIEDIENVDERRKAIGLEPLWSYAQKNHFILPLNYVKKQ